MTSRRDLERRLSDLEDDTDTNDTGEEWDLSLSPKEKEALDEHFDVEPATVKDA